MRQVLTEQTMLTEFGVHVGGSKDETLRDSAYGPTLHAAVGPYFAPIWAQIRVAFSTFDYDQERLDYVDVTGGPTVVLQPTFLADCMVLRLGGDFGVSYGSSVTTLENGAVDPSRSRSSQLLPLIGGTISFGFGGNRPQVAADHNLNKALVLDRLANTYKAMCLGKLETVGEDQAAALTKTCKSLLTQINERIELSDECHAPQKTTDDPAKFGIAELERLRTGISCLRSSASIQRLILYNLVGRGQWAIGNSDGWNLYSLGFSVIF
jgi:hypothetical protein